MNVKMNKQTSFSSFTLIELLVNAACKTGVLYNRCGMLLSKGGAFVRMSTEWYGVRRRRIRLVSPNNKIPRFFGKKRGAQGKRYPASLLS